VLASSKVLRLRSPDFSDFSYQKNLRIFSILNFVQLYLV
jgi:hypothetical protein